jgi:hypothetical protein
LHSNTQTWPPIGNGTTTWCTRVAKINVLWLITTTMCKPANKGGVLYSQKHLHCRDSPHKYKDMFITQERSYSLLHITMHFTGITVYMKGLFTSILFINVLCFPPPPQKKTLPRHYIYIYGYQYYRITRQIQTTGGRNYGLSSKFWWQGKNRLLYHHCLNVQVRGQC